MKSILSANQKRLLEIFSQQAAIRDHFYLTGGTALAEFYLHHRLSEDLDFFSETEFEPQAVSTLLAKIKPTAGIVKITHEQSFNRNLFLLELKNDNIKTEFTYFPFPRINVKQKAGELAIDSLLDIVVNKIFTIYQKPRARDFIDLYCILQQETEWQIDDLIHQAQAKFDHFVDPLQLAGQFTKAETLKDYPTLVIDLPPANWQQFFLTEAKRLSGGELK